MRRFPFILALGIAACLFPGNTPGFAQGQESPQQSTTGNQAPPPDAPQPQKKPGKPSKPANTPDANQPGSSSGAPASSSKDNPFPEDVSRNAAQADSSEAKPDTAPGAQKNPSAQDNPFPEDVSRKAAEGNSNSGPDARNNATPTPPPGVSSSSSSSAGEEEGEPNLNGKQAGRRKLTFTDPARAEKDTKVGKFYLQTGNYQGAYLRYKDANTIDPTNVDAIYGLAEAARGLKKYDEAKRNYELYLQIVPDGPKAKEASKMLSSLSATE
jgi:Tetratricopeptide repeat